MATGEEKYDDLSEQEQAVVRQRWAAQMKARRNELNYAAQFAAAGQSYSEADEDGNVMVHSTRD